MAEERIPATMMTQHPDSSTYVSIQEEPKEAIFSLAPYPEGLGLEEVMVDFEGKLTPYQQTSQIVLGLIGKGLKVGRDVFVTPRIPSGAEEGVFRQLMALMSVVESNYQAEKKTGSSAIREVILPMTRSAGEIVTVRERIIDVINLANKEFGLSKDPESIRIIPLIETIPQILKVDQIIGDYIKGCKELGLVTTKLRYMLGLSDLALTYGMVVAALATKIAISDGYRLSCAMGIEIYPILGGGALPFRGGFFYDNIENVINDFSGVRTLTIQSALRYDHGYEETRRVARLLSKRLVEQEPLKIGQTRREEMLNLIAVFAKNYLVTFYGLMEVATKISDIIPGQRDRLARKSDVGYARDLPHPDELASLLTDRELAREIGKMKRDRGPELPRAISFTAALYSIGLPPEIIGVGRGLKEVQERYGKASLALLLEDYHGLKDALTFACRFVHLKNAEGFLPKEVISQVEEDIALIAEYLNIFCVKESKQDRLYQTILETMRPMLSQIVGIEAEAIISDEGLELSLVNEWILRLAKMRGSLG